MTATAVKNLNKHSQHLLPSLTHESDDLYVSAYSANPVDKAHCQYFYASLLYQDIHTW
jgi:hypothetical protein